MNATWNLAQKSRSQKINKIDYKKVTKTYCKMISKELQYGYSKGTETC